MNIIKVLMLKDDSGSPDGVVVRDYKKGQEYDLPESLAESFIESKTAKKPKPDK